MLRRMPSTTMVAGSGEPSTADTTFPRAPARLGGAAQDRSMRAFRAAYCVQAYCTPLSACHRCMHMFTHHMHIPFAADINVHAAAIVYSYMRLPSPENPPHLTLPSCPPSPQYSSYRQTQPCVPVLPSTTNPSPTLAPFLATDPLPLPVTDCSRPPPPAVLSPPSGIPPPSFHSGSLPTPLHRPLPSCSPPSTAATGSASSASLLSPPLPLPLPQPLSLAPAPPPPPSPPSARLLTPQHSSNRQCQPYVPVLPTTTSPSPTLAGTSLPSHLTPRCFAPTLPPPLPQAAHPPVQQPRAVPAARPCFPPTAAAGPPQASTCHQTAPG